MKILHISSFFQVCGIATFAENIFNAMCRTNPAAVNIRVPLHSDHAKEIDGLFDRIDHYKSIEITDCDFACVQHEFGIWGKNYAESLVNFYFFIRRLKKHAEAIQITFHTIPDLKLDKTLNIGFFKGLANSINTFLFRIYMKFLLKGGKVYIHSMSTTARKFFINRYKLPDSVFFFYPHPFPSLTYSEPIKIRGTSSKDVLIGIFGFVGKYKGHLVLLDALELLPNNYKVVIFGQSHPENRFNPVLDKIAESKFQLIKKHPRPNKRAESRIFFTYVPEDGEILNYLRGVDLLVAPYLPVNLSSSGAITFAIASGRPLIASNINAFMDLYKEAKCFFPIDSDSPHQLAAAIIDLHSNDNAKIKITEAAEAISSKYTFDAFCLSCLEFLQLDKKIMRRVGGR